MAEKATVSSDTVTLSSRLISSYKAKHFTLKPKHNPETQPLLGRFLMYTHVLLALWQYLSAVASMVTEPATFKPEERRPSILDRDNWNDWGHKCVDDSLMHANWWRIPRVIELTFYMCTRRTSSSGYKSLLSLFYSTAKARDMCKRGGATPL